MKITKSSKPGNGAAFRRFYKNKIIKKEKNKLKNKKCYITANKPTRKKIKVEKTKPYKGKPTNGAKCAKKRAKRLGRISIHADYSIITSIYLKCRRLNIRAGGHAYDVDHILPYFAGGLHHHDNLQILSVTEHKIKTTKDIIIYSDCIK